MKNWGTVITPAVRWAVVWPVAVSPLAEQSTRDPKFVGSNTPSPPPPPLLAIGLNCKKVGLLLL